ncbi:MAG: hypothetical protein AB1473_09775 [Thermodesulfobacteriota bacterium]
MPEYLQILLSFCFLVAAFVLSRYIVTWKLKRSAKFIIDDLEAKGAVDPITAVDLSYAKPSLLRIGMRDYHSKALESMVNEGVITRTSAGKYFLQTRRTTEKTS